MKASGDYTSVSQGTIALLCDRGLNLTQIAQLLGVTKSYISRVRAGTRSLTLDHLADLQLKLGEPIPLLLVNATPLSTVPPQLRRLYKATKKLLSLRTGKTRRARRAA